LAFLTLFAVGLGHRAALNLRIVRYQRDRLKACYLAKAGIKRVIEELDKDNNETDTLKETWSTGVDSNNNRIFDHIEIKKDSGDKFNIKSVLDEKGRFNLNGASASLLAGLFLSKSKIQAAPDCETLSNLILAYRGEQIQGMSDILGFKKAQFSAPEELLLVLEYYFKSKNDGSFKQSASVLYSQIKDYITVCPAGSANLRINLNTVSADGLTILLESIAQDTEKSLIPGLAQAIIDFRNGPSFVAFTEPQLLDIKLDQRYNDLLNELGPYLIFNSDYFRIESEGLVGNSKKHITVVYNRQVKKNIYWHED
jgi:type II secretory pathway component PulK